MKRTCVLLCGIGALLHQAEPAAARCAGPRVAISSAGEAVPEDPVIYVFVPRRHSSEELPAPFSVVARSGGRTLPVAFEEGAGTPAYRSYRVRVTTGEAKRFTLRYGEEFPVSRRFRIDPNWQRPGAVENSFTSVSQKDSWTCSFTDAWMLYPNVDAPAYLVEWSHDEAAVGSDAGRSLLAPRSTSLFWEDTGPAGVALGHINCFDWTIPASAREQRLYVRVAPLYADGSRGPYSDIVALGQPTDDGPRSTDDGQRSTDDGPRSTDDGPRSTDDAPRSTDDGPRSTDDAPRCSLTTAALWSCFLGLSLGVFLLIRRRF